MPDRDFRTPQEKTDAGLRPGKNVQSLLGNTEGKMAVCSIFIHRERKAKLIAYGQYNNVSFWKGYN